MSRSAYPKYEASEIDWLGAVPSHWEVKRLKYVALRADDKVEADVENPLPYIGLENVEPWTGRLLPLDIDLIPTGVSNRFRQGDTLFGKLRPYLAKACNVDFEGLCSSELLVLRPVHQNKRFLLYLLLTKGFISLVDSSTYGAKMPRAGWSFVGSCRLPVPPADEQRAIADFLDEHTATLGALIASRQALVERMKEKRAALISRTVTKGLDPNAPMKDSGVAWLGEIPEHWVLKRLKHLLKPRKGAIKTGPFGSQLQSSEMQAGDIKVYNQRSVLDRDFATGENYISFQKFDELRSFEAFPGDLLITTRGSIGRCSVLPVGAERGILHPCVMRIQVDPRLISTRFLEVLIQDGTIVLDQLRLMSNATTIDVIYSESLREVLIALPPPKDQDAIVEFVDRETALIDEMVAKVETAIDRLQEYRAALITAAVTGKIDVREAA